MKIIKVIVATHKKEPMPKDDMYLPLEVGVDMHGKQTGYQSDNTGSNISRKNAGFCELTGLYWAWKNLDADYIGLVHYRRHFASRLFNANKQKNILNSKKANLLLEKCPVILPKKRHYFIENLYSHYSHTMYIEPLDEAGKIILEKFPEYYKQFQLLKHRTSAHMFNMFIMKKEIFDDYCNWLFDILFELEKRIEYDKYDAFHARFFWKNFRTIIRYLYSKE